MIGKLICDRFQITQMLGKGGFATTFLAKDILASGLIVVVKQLTLNAVASSQENARFHKSFIKEVEKLKELGSYATIPTLYGSCSDGKNFYIIQEFIDGYDLNELIAPPNFLSEKETLQILCGILMPLQLVHKAGIIHRDIKPSNIRIRQNKGENLGEIVLIDFGISKKVDLQSSNSTLIGFTPGYAPIEQIMGDPKFSSDIYPIGIIGIQALTGLRVEELPIDNGKLDTSNIVASPQLLQILQRMIQPHSEHRYQDAHEALEALQLIAGNAPYRVSLPNELERIASPLPTIQRQQPTSSNSLTNKLGQDNTFLKRLLLVIGIFGLLGVIFFLLKPKATQWKTYASKDYKFSLDYPEQWNVKPVKNTFTGDVISIEPILNDKNICEDNISVNIQLLPERDLEFESYKERAIQKVKLNNIQPELVDETTPSTQLGSQEAYQISHHRNTSNCKTQVVEVGTVKDGKSYFIAYETTESNYIKNKEIFTEIAKRFKLKL
jgi:eukaryotic-like serine/threonine-protein kinase